MGLPKMKQHWRNLVACYGAYPVVWCLAGETTLPTYSHWLKPGAFGLPHEEMAEAGAGWTEMSHYLRALDPYHNPVCTHPSPFTNTSGRKALVAEGTVDFDMLQTGHGGYESLEPTVQAVTAAVAQAPRMLVINGEVNYEGIMGACSAEAQRFLFWTCITAGGAATLMAPMGVWQMNSCVSRAATGVSRQTGGTHSGRTPCACPARRRWAWGASSWSAIPGGCSSRVPSRPCRQAPLGRCDRHPRGSGHLLPAGGRDPQAN